MVGDESKDHKRIDRQIVIIRVGIDDVMISSDDAIINLNMVNGSIDIGLNHFNGGHGTRSFNLVSSKYTPNGIRFIDFASGLKADPPKKESPDKSSATTYYDEGWNFNFKAQTKLTYSLSLQNAEL